MGLKYKFLASFIFLALGIQFIQAQNWPKIYGDSFDAYVLKAFEDYDRGFIIGGDILANPNTFRYAWIIKTDINGNVLWDKKYGTGTDKYYLASCVKTNDDGIIFCGATDVDGLQMDPLFVKLNPCGEPEWCKIFLSPGANWGTGVIKVDDGSIGMLEYYTVGQEYRISLVKMNLQGEPLWIQYLAQEDTLIFNEEGYDLLLTSTNNYLISGRCFYPGQKPFWIMTDTAGEQVWDLKWNCRGTCFQTIEHHSGIYYGIGNSFPVNPNIPTIYKFGNSGNEISRLLLMGDTVASSGGGSILAINDTTLISGVVWNDLGFPNEIQHSEVFKTDTLGNLKQRRLLLYEDEGPTILKLTSDNKIIVAGDYVVDNNWDIYLWKMNSDLEDDTLYTQPITYDSLCPHQILSDTVDLDCSLFVNINEIPTKEEYESIIKISPNPARDWIALTLPDNLHSGIMELAIYNFFGQGVMKTSIVPQNRTVSLNISGLSSGLYLAVCLDSKRKAFKGKFIIAR